jgi:hypothetical protein
LLLFLACIIGTEDDEPEAACARLESFGGIYNFLQQTTISGKTELLLQSNVQNYSIGVSNASSNIVWGSMIMDAITVQNLDLFVNR